MLRRSPRLRSHGHCNSKSEPVPLTNIRQTEIPVSDSTGTRNRTSTANKNDLSPSVTEVMLRRSPRLRSQSHYKSKSEPVPLTNIRETETPVSDSTGTHNRTSTANKNELLPPSVTKADILLNSWKTIGYAVILVLIPLLLWVLLPWLTSALSTLLNMKMSIKEEQPVLTNMDLEPILVLEKVQQNFQHLTARIADLSQVIRELEAEDEKLTELISSPAQLVSSELVELMEKWFSDHIKEQDAVRLTDKESNTDRECPIADKMADFALESQGGFVVRIRNSEAYRTRTRITCVALFGIPLWCPPKSPQTVIQGGPVYPGQCWPFHGDKVSLVIALSHPARITHVTLDHLPRYNSPTGNINSAPKDFKVHGMKTSAEEGTLLGTFMYDHNGVPTQTFSLPNPTDDEYQFVELHILSNWGRVEYTCLYRFRVHGKISSN